jgi:hypothetical protein
MFSVPSGGNEHYSNFNYNLLVDQFLDTYKKYTSSLNPDYLYNIAAAERKLKELSSGSPTYIINSAFIPFWNFYLTAADYWLERQAFVSIYSRLAVL